MPTWGEILGEVNGSAAANNGRPDLDGIRAKYLRALRQLTGRETIVYYTDWINGPRPNTNIVLGDMQGFMEVCKDLQGPSLDFFVHSPGGIVEAAASIVRYIRQKFSDVRVFVPLAAMSAATMLALSGNRIVMGKHSQLGPIDPQLTWPSTGMQAPAGAIREQFDKAVEEIKKDASVLGAWIPILQQYAPALLVQCQLADELGRKLVSEWLAKYMLRGKRNAKAKADAIVEYFGDYKKRGSHSIGVGRDEARKLGVIVDDLEVDPRLQDAVLSVHHATIISVSGGVTKIIENDAGKRFVSQAAQIPIQFPIGMFPMPTGPAPQTPPGAPR